MSDYINKTLTIKSVQETDEYIICSSDFLMTDDFVDIPKKFIKKDILPSDFNPQDLVGKATSFSMKKS